MLIRMLYTSTASGPLTTALTGSILRSAQAYNAANNITGVLCQGQGVFLQVLEGDRLAVNGLYARILADKRHQKVVLLSLEEITRRRYGAWAMAHVNLSTLDPVMQLSSTTFDSYSASGQQIMAQLDGLIDQGLIMNKPVV